MLDCRPTAIVCVTNLSPGNRVLQDNYDRIVAEYLDLDIETFGVERFLRPVPVRPRAADGPQRFSPVPGRSRRTRPA